MLSVFVGLRFLADASPGGGGGTSSVSAFLDGEFEKQMAGLCVSRSNIGDRDGHIDRVADFGVIRHLKFGREFAVPEMGTDAEVRRIESDRTRAVRPVKIVIVGIRFELDAHRAIERARLEQPILWFFGDLEIGRELPSIDTAPGHSMARSWK